MCSRRILACCRQCRIELRLEYIRVSIMRGGQCKVHLGPRGKRLAYCLTLFCIMIIDMICSGKYIDNAIGCCTLDLS